MAAPNIDTAAILTSVRNAKGVVVSATTFVKESGTKLQEAVRKALEEDDTLDQAQVDAAMLAVKPEFDELDAKAAELAEAITVNP